MKACHWTDHKADEAICWTCGFVIARDQKAARRLCPGKWHGETSEQDEYIFKCMEKANAAELAGNFQWAVMYRELAADPTRRALQQ